MIRFLLAVAFTAAFAGCCRPKTRALTSTPTEGWSVIAEVPSVNYYASTEVVSHLEAHGVHATTSVALLTDWISVPKSRETLARQILANRPGLEASIRNRPWVFSPDRYPVVNPQGPEFPPFRHPVSVARKRLSDEGWTERDEEPEFMRLTSLDSRVPSIEGFLIYRRGPIWIQVVGAWVSAVKDSRTLTPRRVL
jgi:hypothetical protein